MQRPLAKLAPAVACALALVVGACGGTSYKEDLSKAEADFKRTASPPIVKMQAATTTEQYARAATALRAAIATFEGKLRKLKPPSEARAAQARHLAALDALSRDLDQLVGVLRSSNERKLKRLLAKEARDLEIVRQTARELDRKAR